MTKTKIPKTIEEAQEALDGLGKLLTAKEWERAAIIYAFTDPVTGNQAARTGGLSIEGFAARGITGLKSHTTIREYRKNWQWAIDNGMAVEVKPGDAIELPTHGWPPSPRQHSSTKSEVVEGFRKMVEEDPAGAVGELIQDSPATTIKLAKGVRSHRGLAALSDPALDVPVEEREAPTRPVATPRDFGADLTTAVNLLTPALYAIERGEWTPTTTQQLLLHAIALLISKTKPGETPGDLFDEIDRYLKEGVS